MEALSVFKLSSVQFAVYLALEWRVKYVCVCTAAFWGLYVPPAAMIP